jgi:4'-phosphopantetheinyl transferase
MARVIDPRMPPKNDSAAPYDFAGTVGRALTSVGFVVPGADEACVLLFDSALWTDHASSAEDLLDTGERGRAARFRFEHDRVRYVLAHAVWRVAIGVCVGVDAARVPLVSTQTGQPQLPGTGLSTSQSHSGRWVAIAICAAATVGVDIERSPPRIALDELIPTMCTPGEMSALKKLAASAREPALMDLWTRKEALLKAFGVGLIADPALLSAMTIDPVMPPASAPGQAPCRVRNIALPAGLVCALAAPVAVGSPRLYLLDGVPPTRF